MKEPLQLDGRSMVGWSTDQIAAEVDGQVVVMGLSQGKYVGFDDVATAIWRRIEKPCTIDDLCHDLAQAFDGSRQQILQDTMDLLRQLHELGLIDIRNNDNAG